MADEYILRSIAIAKLTALEVTNPFATIADAKRVLADMAAADVASVVHGKWGDNGIAGSMAGRFGFQTGETLRSTPEHTERMTDLWNRRLGVKRTIRRCRCGKRRN